MYQPTCFLFLLGHVASDAGAMTKAGQCAAVGAVLVAVWAAVITGTVGTNETVVGLMPFAPFYLLCCFGVSAARTLLPAHTRTRSLAHTVTSQLWSALASRGYP